MIHTVDVYKTSVLSLETRMEEYLSYLSADEYIRASNFKRKSDQKKFMLIRGYLRWLLSQKIEVEPHEIKFVYGLNRKPELPSNHYFFNVSHSKHQVLIGLSPFTPVGVDIEYYRDISRIGHPLFFHHSEQAFLQQAESNKKIMAMLWLWTRKEALCKATGEGLTPNLQHTSLLEDYIIYKGQSYKLFSEISKSEVYSVCIPVKE